MLDGFAKNNFEKVLRTFMVLSPSRIETDSKIKSPFSSAVFHSQTSHFLAKACFIIVKLYIRISQRLLSFV